MTAQMSAVASPEDDRNTTIAVIRKVLRERSGRAWSVTGGTGTSWGWITITAPPARRERGVMTDEDAAELGRLLGKGQPVHCQGESVPASREYRRAYIEMAKGLPVTVVPTPYWD